MNLETQRSARETYQRRNRDKVNAAHRDWYQRNREQIRERREFRLANENPEQQRQRRLRMDRKLAKAREDYARNRIKILAKQKAARDSNIELHRTRGRAFYHRNRERVLAKAHRYWKNNQEKLRKDALAYHYRMMQSNPKEMRAKWCAYVKARYANDLEFRMKVSLRRSISSALKGISKAARTEALVGCDVKTFVSHIEKLWLPGMHWGNHGAKGRCWHLDHIKPCAMFDLTDPTQQKICFHYSNLRPLWSHENHSKGSLWEGVRYRRKTPKLV